MRLLINRVALTALLPITAAAAQDAPPGLRDLVGARAGQAEGELGRRGYRAVRTETGDDRKWTYWFNAAHGRCVTVTTLDGRYASIVETPAADCRSGATTTPATPQDGRPIHGSRPW